MSIKTFRAKSIQQALQLVRQELGVDAEVLHTRRLNTGLISRWVRGSQVEVAATAGMTSPAVSKGLFVASPEVPAVQTVASVPEAPAAGDHMRANLASHGIDLTASNVRRRVTEIAATQPAPTALFDAYTAMIEADFDEPVARELLDEARVASGDLGHDDPGVMLQSVRRLVEHQFTTTGPIVAGPSQQTRRVVALVGPTGVGKTTTIAKLAANFRLRQKLKVGLVTVDTYRVAAVEQLQTYADIIDLPMEVVATPREMRAAIEKFQDMDLVLMDTAGRSPRDAVKVQELRSILAEANPDEVHLVLSTTAGSRNLVATTERFAGVGVTSLLLTKLDEATGLGPLVTLARASGLPISYLTNGQNVPDDIAVADAAALVNEIFEPAGDTLGGRLSTGWESAA